jgi:hypothetical protein
VTVVFDLYAYVRPQVLAAMTGAGKHRHGSYATHQLAEWWAINAKGVWVGGDLGPHNVFVPLHRVYYWAIEARET